MKRCILLIWFISRIAVNAATFVTDGSETQVQNAINNGSLANGDTITMASGTTNYWTWTLTNTLGVNFTLQGLGGPIFGVETNAADVRHPTNYFNATPTVIMNNTRGTMIKFSIATNTSLMRMTGFTIQGVTTNMPVDTSAQACVWWNGTASMFRIDNIDMQLVGETCFEEDGWINGVNDHINLNNNGYFGWLIDHQSWGGYISGDGSWASPRTFGTTNAIYIETSTLKGGNHVTSPGVYDMGEKGGGRVVLRNSYIECWNLGHHGTESSQRNRGGVQFEFYNCWLNNTNTAQPWFTANFVRSGTGITFSNLYDGYDRMGTYEVYRTGPGGGWTPWGNCDGTNAWDNTDGNIVATGTATANSVMNSGVSVETNFDSNATFTPGQFITSSGGVYSILNTSGTSSAEILDNGVNWVAYRIVTPTSATEHFTTGQGYRIAGIITNVLDMTGLGVGDLITNNGSAKPVNATRGGVVAWVNEVIDPCYSWSNTFHNDGNLFRPFHSSTAPCYTNIHFFDGVIKPGYVQLVYPHPLVVTPTPLDPNITVQPSSQSVTVGQTATFNITATGTATLHYQWKFNGSNVGSDANSYARSNCQLADTGGSVTCVVTGPGINSPQTSITSILTVTGDPLITVQPQNQSIQVGQSATFTITATGQTTLSYQWKSDGTTIGGATQSTLVFGPATDVITWNGILVTCVVTDVAGSLTSSAATLTVTNAPGPGVLNSLRAVNANITTLRSP